MTTIVNSPTPTTNSNGFGFLIGVIIIVGFLGILLFFGIPLLQRMGPIELNVPAPQIAVPNKIDVNVKETK